MPVTYLVNRNIVGNPILGSNIAAPLSSNIFSIVADPAGNVYVSGSYMGAASTNYVEPASSTGPATGNTTFTLPNTGTTATGGLFVKYYSNGTPAYSLGMTAGANVVANSVTLDATASNVFVAFSYQTVGAATMTVNTPTTTGGSVSAVVFPATQSAATLTWGTGLLKINAATGAILWGAAVDAGFNGDQDQVGGVTVDQFGNSYIGFLYNTSSATTLAVYNGALGTLTTTGSTVSLPATSTGVALIKFGPSGIAQWQAVTTATTTPFVSNTLGIDSAGNVIMGLQVTGTATVNTGVQSGSGTGYSVTNTAGTTAAILIKYNTGGLTSAPVLWIAQMYGASGTTSQIYGITCGQYNSVYITGSTTSTSTISIYNGNGTGSAPSVTASTINIPGNATTASQQAFLAKFSSNTGAIQYVSYLPSVATTAASNFYIAYPNPSDTDLYVAARYFNSVNAQTIINSNGTTAATTLPLTSGNTNNPVLIRYFLGNAISAQAIPTSLATQAYTAFVDPSATNVYVGGSYYNTITTTLNQAGPTGGTAPSTVVLPITATNVTTAWWAKYS